MKSCCRLILLGSITMAAVASHALTVNVFIDNPSAVVIKPVAGTTSYMFTGRIQITGTPSGGTVSTVRPYLSGSNTDFLTTTFAPNLTAALNSLLNTPNQTYVGDLFSVNVPSTAIEGFYNHSANTTEAPYFRVLANSNGFSAKGEGSYVVNVVPEPTTMALLALPAIAFLRRKKK